MAGWIRKAIFFLAIPGWSAAQVPEPAPIESDEEAATQLPGYVEVVNPAFPATPLATAPEPISKRYRLEDFAGYFTQGGAARAKSEFDAGRYGRAWALLSAEGDGAPLPTRYLRALSATRAGRLKEGAEEMAKLAVLYPPLRDRCLTHAAVAREELGQWSEAASLYVEIEPSSRLYVDARFGLARSRRKLNDLRAAALALEPLNTLSAPMWGRDVGAEALAATADLARSQRNSKGEQEALIKLWARHPLSPLADLARIRLGRKQPQVENQLLRAEMLLDSHRNKAALAVLRPLTAQLKLPEPLACRAQFALGKGLRKEREHTLAISALQPVVEQCQDPELLARALYVLGSSGSIVNPEVGLAAYQRLARDYPDHPFADDALVFAAELELKREQPDPALLLLGQVADRYPDGDFAAEALFKSYWLRRSQGNAEAARKVLATIERRFADAEESYEIDRAHYWRARDGLARGDRSAAVRDFVAVAQGSPATYYGLISRQQLSELDPEKLTELQRELKRESSAPASPWPIEANAIGEDSHFAAGVELLRMGLLEGAAAEFLAVKRAELPVADRRLLVQLMALSDDARSAHAVARTSLRGDLSGKIGAENRSVWEVAYPNAFRSLIERFCGESKLDPDLLQALMREESALDPKALSWAGALGLTQLMPTTANAVAKTLKLKRVSTQALLEPELNIRLGAAYLGSLVKKFGGNLPYAIASYNAGAGNVSRWRAALPNKALDEWVEEIPIAETRGYVKRVLRTYNTYQLLYGRGVPARVAGDERRGEGRPDPVALQCP